MLNYRRTEKNENVVQMVQWLCQSKLNSGFTATAWHRRRTIENQTLTTDLNLENVVALSDRLAKLDKTADQTQLSEAIEGATLVQIAAVSNHGERISGSAERAVAAWLNATMPVTLGAQWFNVEYRDKTDIAKALTPHKKDIFTAWKSSNPSTKWKRVRDYGEELAKPALCDLVNAIEDEDERAQYMEHLGLDETETEDGSGSGNTSNTRDLYERSVVELGKLYRALNASDNDAVIKAHNKRAEIIAALEHITKALTALDAPLEDEALVDFMKAVAKR